MKKIILLFINVAIATLAFAYRGETIEYKGVIYTVVSECNLRTETYNEGAKKNIVECKRYGEVYVSEIRVSDIDLVIDPVIKVNTKKDSKKPVVTEYSVVGVGDKAFMNAKLTNLILPNNMRFIGNEAFKNMEITEGTFFLPKTKRVLRDAFDGLKARLFILNLNDCGFENTFQNIDQLPEIYVRHNHYSITVNGLNKKLIYSVGDKIVQEWLPKESLQEKMDAEVSYIGDKTMFKTLGDNTVSPAFNIRKSKRFDKIGSNVDMVAPFEYACYNPYTTEQDVYSEFVMNTLVYRVKKGDEYLYFNLDGRPVVDVSSILDNKGQDPFGFPYSIEQIKKFKAVAKQKKAK